MLTDPTPRSQVDALWDKFWTGGLAYHLGLQEEFVPSATLWGSSTGMVARRCTELVEVVELLRGRMGESGMQVCTEGSRSADGLFEALLAESFGNT